MNISNYFKRIINILFRPKSEWKVISRENPDPVLLSKYYILPFIIFNILMGVLSSLIYSDRIIGIRIVSAAVTPFLNILISTYILYAFANKFKSNKDFTRSFQLITYSYIPIFFIHYINYLSPFTDLWVFSIYGFIILWFGLSHLLNTPNHKKPTYLLILLITLVVIWMIIGTLIKNLLPVSVM